MVIYWVSRGGAWAVSHSITCSEVLVVKQKWSAPLTGVLVGFLVAGCGSPAGVSADDPIFDGIPRPVVREVLHNPVVKTRTEGDDEAARRARMQGIALNFILCRQEYAAYRSWVTTGIAPQLPPPPRLGHPLGGVYRDDLTIRRRVDDMLSGGDIDVLRSDLLNDSGCGVWIPVRPGDASGPTIADAVRGA